MYSVDRVEEGYAVVEHDGEFENIPLSQLPSGVREGDLLKKTEKGWSTDAAETENRRQALAARRRKLLNGEKR
jgi:hypothetical protein